MMLTLKLHLVVAQPENTLVWIVEQWGPDFSQRGPEQSSNNSWYQ